MLRSLTTTDTYQLDGLPSFAFLAKDGIQQESSRLVAVLCCQPLDNAVLQQLEELPDVEERGGGIVVEVHEAVIVVRCVGRDVLDDKPCFLHGGSTMLKLATEFLGGLFQGAVGAESLGS